MTDLPDILLTRFPRKGDTIVHLDHGLCRLGPVRRMTLSDDVVETVELRFHGGETLAVPLTDAVRIWNYGASVPKSGLDRLGSDDWAERQADIAQEMRASLDALSAARSAREQASGFDHPISEHDLAQAGQGFAHELTGDQSAALSDIVDDLARSRATDRLLIGDVGCGKTEVAVRAALALALSGGRVRIVAPTRVLARQHHADIAERAADLGLEVALYSGDLTDGERAALRERRGEIDILVGTKGLLDAAFDGVALTVLDEEQKFGADAKSVDGNLLRLSATPIPRTLAEARVGLADISLISEYPSGRGRTQTSSLDDEDDAVAELIEEEVEGGGQVLILCPRIRDLKRQRKRLRRLLPDLRVGRVHGRRKARRNRDVLARFGIGEVDVLLATSMLETGVNVPGANLMLVFGPHRFGLGQLHQLRGRVGRGERNARFILVRGSKGTKAFRRRVRALEQMDARGDGLRLAVADATLRGAGSFADDDQSGHASALGLELYEYLLGRMCDHEHNAGHLATAIPQVSGEWEWEFEGEGDEALISAFRQSRSALDDPSACLKAGACEPYPTLISAALALDACRAGIGPKGVAFTLSSGETVRADAQIEAVIDCALAVMQAPHKSAA